MLNNAAKFDAMKALFGSVPEGKLKVVSGKAKVSKY
jgi:hypothetical protein